MERLLHRLDAGVSPFWATISIISDKDGDASGPVRVVRVLQNFMSTRVGSWCHSDIHCLNVRRVKPWNGRYRLAAGVSPFWATISIISVKRPATCPSAHVCQRTLYSYIYPVRVPHLLSHRLILYMSYHLAPKGCV